MVSLQVHINMEIQVKGWRLIFLAPTFTTSSFTTYHKPMEKKLETHT